MGDVYQSLKGLFPFVCVDWDFVLHGRLAGWLVVLMVWDRCWLLFSSLMLVLTMRNELLESVD